MAGRKSKEVIVEESQKQEWHEDHAMLARVEQQERDTANQLLGRIQLGQGIQKLVTVTTLIDLQKVKNDKSYKHLTTVDANGKPVTVTTWEHFCRLLGYSPEKVDTDLRNLEAFGADTLESMQRAGLGYRELRKLRKLSDEDRQVLVQEIEADVGDKESILQLIDDLSQKHQQEREALKGEMEKQTKRLEKLEGDLGQKDRLLGDKNKKIDELAAELNKQEAAETVPTPEEQIARFHKQLSELMDDLIVGRVEVINGQTKALPSIMQLEWILRFLHNDAAGETQRVKAAQAVNQLIIELQRIEVEYQLDATDIEPENTDWIAEAKEKSKGGEAGIRFDEAETLTPEEYFKLYGNGENN